MVDTAAEKGMTLKLDEVKGFLKQMDDDDDFDDFELDAVALAAIAEDEPWGRCSGMRPMRKWLFGLTFEKEHSLTTSKEQLDAVKVQLLAEVNSGLR